MRKFNYIISIVILLLTFVSCAKVTDEDTLWQLKSLPVVFSIISPSQTVRVSLSKTILVGEKPDTICYPTATVFVCGEDSNWVELSRLSNDKAIYTDENNQLEIKEGKTYYLRVILPSNTLTAQTTIPVQHSTIESPVYYVDKDFPDSLNYYMGTLYATLSLSESEQCLLTADSMFIGDENSTFLNTDNITSRFSIQGRPDSFDLKLISLDTYFAKYWAARKISVMQNHYDGDLTVFLGTFNGLLPRYSNIVNGVGLFGSYVTNTKTVNITQL